MTIKTPIRTVFDCSGNATGLAEFQTGEAVGYSHGGTGLTCLGSTGQYLKVNSGATGLEWGTLNFATESYVDTAVSNLIDTAPDALNTLNELAAALNDDASFSTTVNNSIATKLAISDFGTYFDNNLANKDTDNLSEGSTNQYYTDARVATYLSNNSYATQSYVQSQIETKDNSDEITEGSTNLYFTQCRARQSISVSGSLSYNASTGVISYTEPADTDSISEGSTNLYYTDARVGNYLTSNSYATQSYVQSQIETKDNTDEITEGSTNLYYTDARARCAVSVTDNGGDGSMCYNGATGVIYYTGPSAAEARAHFSASGDLNYNSSSGQFSVTTYKSSDFATDFNCRSTDNLSEGSTNLYYTTARVNSAFDTRLATKTTADLTECNNLYYTAARVNSAFDTRLAAKDTDNLSEGSTNLYYTDTRVGNYLTTNSYATESYVDTEINNLIGGAPAALDTLNELAAALNDDENFYSSITPTARAAISAGGDLSYNSTTGVVSYSLPANVATSDDAIALSIALG